MSVHDDVFEMVAYLLNEDDLPTDKKLYETLRLLCKYRSQLLANTLLQQGGTRVRRGPFAGLVMPEHAAEGCYIPKLLGSYETELHPILEALPNRQYEAIVNIGCAEGYYAVGLARLVQSSEIHAYDTDPDARRICAELAKMNGVGDRITIGKTFSPSDFERYAGRRTLILCDIEGHEVELLDPEKAPALKQLDLLVEVHDCFVPGCSRTLKERFQHSHLVQMLPFGERPAREIDDEIQPFEDLDRLLCTWEWRLPGNDWMWLTALNQDAEGSA